MHRGLGKATMFVFGSEDFWLNVTNAALGAAILALFVVVAWSVVQELMFPRNGRRV